ncbi:hypothetical protein T458_14725 [Brevibacillus panacihumi W25]|uniref:Uncharacterized protein n=1 Tax=Brevibacillus panacihumi W25 TaxID=1408254 RepID=V6MGV5_9BACL|nr:hypothetical protein T458_14725 [Brevibacillus panacihumi W25]
MGIGTAQLRLEVPLLMTAVWVAKDSFKPVGSAKSLEAFR